tara:strand:- start:133 stop:492 length:360 start_codon:yes stop_codon:yes gene_type:complete
MSTLNVKLTLGNTSALSDVISFSVSDALSVTSPSEMSRINVLHTSPTEFAAASTGTHYVYIKNIGTNSRVVEIRTAGGTSFGQLVAGEFCFVPLLNNGGVEAISLVGSEVVEYAIFKKA